MPLEFPFFTLQTRLDRRTIEKALDARVGYPALAMAGVAVLFGYLRVAHSPHLPTEHDTLPLLLLCLIQIVATVGAVSGCWSRLTGSGEAGRREALFLLPLTPEEWLIQIAPYPLVWACASWLAVVPMVLCGIWTGAIHSADVEPAEWISLGLMLQCICLGILSEQWGPAAPRPAAGSSARRSVEPDMGERAFVAGLAVLFSVIAVTHYSSRGLPGWGGPITGTPFSWAGLFAADTALLMGAALAAARAGRQGTAGEARERRIRWAALFLLAGLVMLVIPVLGRWLLGVGLLVMLVFPRRGRDAAGRRADPSPAGAPPPRPFARWMRRSNSRKKAADGAGRERELAWLAARWDNPVFLRDLRIYSRSGSMLRASADNASGIMVWCIIWSWPALSSPAGFTLPLNLIPVLTLLLVGAVFVLPLARSGKSSSPEQERVAETDIWLTPIPSREILLGRAGAQVVHWWGTHLLVVAAVPVLWLALWLTGSAALAAGIAAALPLALCLYATPWQQRAARDAVLKQRYETQVVAALASGIGSMLAGVYLVQVAAPFTSLGPIAVLPFLILNCWLALRFFKVSVRFLDAARTGTQATPAVWDTKLW